MHSRRKMLLLPRDWPHCELPLPKEGCCRCSRWCCRAKKLDWEEVTPVPSIPVNQTGRPPEIIKRILPRKTVTFRLPEESTRPESTNPFQPLETTIENFPAPDDSGPDDTDRESEFDLILEDPLEPEDDFALDLMSALYKKRKSQLVMIPVEINGTSVTP